MKYDQKHGVSRASRKYNKSRSYIYFWKARWDGTPKFLACQSRRPHHHPNEHTEAELTLIRNMWRRNPSLGLTELWYRLRKRGYSNTAYPAMTQFCQSLQYAQKNGGFVVLHALIIRRR